MGITNILEIDGKISFQMRNQLVISSHTEVDVWKLPSWSSPTGIVDTEWSEGVAHGKKVTQKSVSRHGAKPVSKSTSSVSKPASAYSMRSPSKHKMADRRSKEYRERLNRATKFVIGLHREALKDLEKH